MARLVVRTVALPVAIFEHAISQPLVPAVFLYALTLSPLQYRQRLLSILHQWIHLSPRQIAVLVKSLSSCLALGVASRLNDALNRLALNHWSLRRLGKPWEFGPGKKTELVVVTGGCSGFGYEMVKGFAKVSRVVALDISPCPKELEQLTGVSYYQLDVMDFPAIEATAQRIRDEHGDPSVLINNAGIVTNTTLLTSDARKTQALFQINIASHFIFIKEFLPGMLRAKKGHIVTMSSLASFKISAGHVDYCCTKAATLALHEGLRAELKDRCENGECIQTTSVHPAWHATAMVKPLEDRLNKAGLKIDPPKNVSDAVIKRVLSGRSGLLFVPESFAFVEHTRSWPLWYQDAKGYVNRVLSGFQI